VDRQKSKGDITITMNLYDFNFWFFGPASIWTLSGMVFFLGIMSFLGTRKITSEIKRNTDELANTRADVRMGGVDLERATSELRKDTSELDRELRMTRTSIDKFYQTWQRMYSIWFPLLRFDDSK
jgi:hypothetical protein